MLSPDFDSRALRDRLFGVVQQMNMEGIGATLDFRKNSGRRLNAEFGLP